MARISLYDLNGQAFRARDQIEILANAMEASSFKFLKVKKIHSPNCSFATLAKSSNLLSPSAVSEAVLSTVEH